jgi:hypothetical protein
MLYGSRLLGKVDIVPGMFHVATQCWHINSIPLIPKKSYIVLHEGENSSRHVEIPLSLKSLCVAWMRWLGWAAQILGPGVMVLGMTPYRLAWMNDWAAGAVIWVSGMVILAMAYGFKPLTHARYCRAAKLGSIANLGESGMSQLQTIYGVVPAVVVKVSRPKFGQRVSQESYR